MSPERASTSNLQTSEIPDPNPVSRPRRNRSMPSTELCQRVCLTPVHRRQYATPRLISTMISPSRDAALVR